MATQEDPELTSPHRHTQATAIYETIYSEKKEKKTNNWQSDPCTSGKQGKHIQAVRKG